MGRIARTPQEVCEFVERVIRKDATFDCVKPGRLAVHEPDARGCNWSLEAFTGPEEVVRECVEAIEPLVREWQALVHVEIRT